jgi:hypothetical protein
MGNTGVLTPTGVAQVWYSSDDSTSESSSAYPYVRLNMTFTEDSIAWISQSTSRISSAHLPLYLDTSTIRPHTVTQRVLGRLIVA